MIELIIQEGAQELLRSSLTEGRHRLGRTSDNQVALASSHLSRQHMEIEVTANGVMVTDLGSTNGTMLRGRKLPPNTPATWPEPEPLQVGPLTLCYQITAAQPAAASLPASSAPAIEEPPTVNWVAHITCREAQPSTFTLETGFATVGSGVRADIRPLTGNVEAEHCRLTLHQNQMRVINLSQNNPVKLGGVPVPLNQPTPWPKTQALEVGYARLFYTLAQASDAAAVPVRSSTGRWLAVIGSMGGILTICIVVVALIALWGNPSDDGDGFTIFNNDGPATPTLAPQVSATPTVRQASTLQIVLETPSTISTDSTPEDECAVAAAATEGSGWLELPFPYEGIEPKFGDGSPEQFRLISQRSRSAGGRINSFFDHQYPIYPPAFSGQETDDVATTMLLFDGSLSFDAFSQDEDSVGSDARFDYYSGHAGIDFSPAPVGDPRVPQTPVFAAADGFLYTARVDDDGNHMVWLSHDRGADGIYATLYFHLADDEFFQAMLAMEEGAEIPAGTRLGTMGTTGRSTGIHLHFEVRKDINEDGLFSIYEKIDPYGYFPSEEYPVDPWSQPWLDRTAKERDGIASEYLWIYPLVDVENEQDACLPQTEVKIDVYPILGWTVVHPGFTYIARNNEGVPIDFGPTILRELTVRADAPVWRCVEPENVRFKFIPYGSSNVEGESLPTEFNSDPTGTFIFFRTEISGSGQYLLAGRKTQDCTPPITFVNLSGQQVPEADNVFYDTVRVTLTYKDQDSPTSPLQKIEYSLDCGNNWQVYSVPFTVTLDTPHSCGGQQGSEGIQFGENDFLLLAIATDSMNNIEQPARQVRFTIVTPDS